MRFRAILSALIGGFISENLSKVDKMITKSVNALDSGLKQFGDSMDSITKELSNDVEQSSAKSHRESKKNQDNLKKIYGDSKVKLWSDRPFKL